MHTTLSKEAMQYDVIIVGVGSAVDGSIMPDCPWANTNIVTITRDDPELHMKEE